MKTRIITAIVACCILLPVLIFSDTPALPGAMALCALIAVYEMVSCIGLKKAYVLNIPLYIYALGFPFFIRYAANIELIRQVTLAVCLVTALYFFSVLTFSHGKYKLADISICFITVFYILAGFNSIMILRDYELGGKYVYLTVFLGAWITDTFAYFCGMLFGRGGKHKLIPDVSPKKTVEGSIGGIIFCMIGMVVFGVIINHISDTLHANYLFLVLGGFLASVVSQIGDLCMSVIKRTYGIKDYGKLFPGHGGMLDRFDSVIAVSIVLAAFCSFFNFFEVI
ncbi:MAG: phosphatidate cytidylyltransferase [Clostridia bacterium]|nr:phosphatidate cytidylyltransferase [Clostridia bacterium]